MEGKTQTHESDSQSNGITGREMSDCSCNVNIMVTVRLGLQDESRLTAVGIQLRGYSNHALGLNLHSFPMDQMREKKIKE